MRRRWLWDHRQKCTPTSDDSIRSSYVALCASSKRIDCAVDVHRRHIVAAVMQSNWLRLRRLLHPGRGIIRWMLVVAADVDATSTRRGQRKKVVGFFSA